LINTSKPYHTTDAAETAYLMANHVRYISEENNPLEHQTTFILQESHEGQIGDLLLDWRNKQCKEYAFFLKYKFVLKRCDHRDKKNGNGNGNTY
jgi:hypothetical protein